MERNVVLSSLPIEKIDNAPEITKFSDNGNKGLNRDQKSASSLCGISNAICVIKYFVIQQLIKNLMRFTNLQLIWEGRVIFLREKMMQILCKIPR